MKVYLRFSILSLMLALLPVAVIAQFELSGIVKDASSNEVLPFANVFIANTQIGTTVQEDGRFFLKRVASGNQEIVVSFVGYETLVYRLNVNEYSAKKEIELSLKRMSIELAGVDVKALSKKKRKRYLKKFTSAFLGETENAAHCKILNPEVLDFKKEGKKIVVSAQDLVKVENRATGYSLKFYLEHFEMEGKQIAYAGKPLFQQLNATSKKEKNKWKQNRKITYEGSGRHFYTALLNNELKKEGFEIYLAKLKNNQEFVTLGALKAKNILQKASNSNYQFLRLNDFLKVVYNRERKEDDRNMGSRLGNLGHSAESEMIHQTKREVGTRGFFPTSYLFARKARVKLSNNGRLLEPEMVLTYGDWSKEGVADLLPFDYDINSPEASKAIENTPTKKGFQLSKLQIPFDEIQDGGPPKDGIPSIDQPKFVWSIQASFLKNEEEVLGVVVNGMAKAYPRKIMDRHEIVNDRFGSTPVAVTFCPLCASGVGVLAEINGQRRTFGVSGLLYNSDVLLYDRETESLWSQIKGEAISGPASGTTMEFIPTEFTTWGDWKARYPETLVLSPETGFNLDYDKVAYEQYLQSQQLVFPVAKKSTQLKNKEKVIGIEVDGQFKAYPLKKLAKKTSPIEDEVNGKTLKVYYNKRSQSARIVDENGEILPAITLFWFAWYAFHPETALY